MRTSNNFKIEESSQSSFTPDDIELILKNIDELKDISDIEELQKKLHLDYKLLAKEFATSRISRVDSYLSIIENLQAQLKKNYNAHEVFITNNLPIIDPITGLSCDSLETSKTIKRKQFDDNQLKHLGSTPPPVQPNSPVLNTLPIFQESFDDLMKPHKKKLESFKKHYQYETKLLEDTTRKNLELVWRQSIKDKIELRKNLRNQLTNEKWDLEKDYNNISKNEKIQTIEQRYRISKRKIGETKKKPSDLQRINELVKSRIENHPNIILQVSSIPMASESEISSDLEMIKNKSLDLKSSTFETNYLYQERKEPEIQIERQQSITYTDFVNETLQSSKSLLNPTYPSIIQHPQVMNFQPPQLYTSSLQTQNHLLQPTQFQQRTTSYQNSQPQPQPQPLFNFNQQTQKFDIRGNQLLMTNYPQTQNWTNLNNFGKN